MRISDWSSDGCSSYLGAQGDHRRGGRRRGGLGYGLRGLFLDRFGERGEQQGGGQGEYGQQRVLAVRRQPARQRADDDGRDDQGRPSAVGRAWRGERGGADG